MLRTRLLPLLSAIAIACGGAGPAAAPPQTAKACPPIPLKLTLAASRRSNALASGEGLPVQVRVYQLRSDARLRTASFEDIWQSDSKVLEGEVVSSEQHTIFPGSKQTITVSPKPDANYLGLVALFREPQGKDWLLTYEIAPPNSQSPCAASAAAIPVWLDRMQIQDGVGREAEADAASDANPGPDASAAGGQ